MPAVPTRQACGRCGQPVSGEHAAIDCAIEMVVGHLADLGRDDLAAEVAAATDPTPPAKKAEMIVALREAWLNRGRS
jgi:hypothetical protein